MKKFFVYKCKSSLSLALLYLVDLFISKLKTRCNDLFLHNYFKYKKKSQELELNKCLQKFICQQEKATTAVIIIFALNYLTLLVYTKTIIHLSVGG